MSRSDTRLNTRSFSTVIQRLNLGYPALVEMYRRMVFNIAARNQDDHTRNIAFLMDRDGTWRLAPAFDVVWAFNESGAWTNRHQMTANGKRDHFERADLLTIATTFGIKQAGQIIDEVTDAVAGWTPLAQECGVDPELLKHIASTHRTSLAGA